MGPEPTSETRLRHQLDVQSRQIKRVLNHHHVAATVTGGTVRPKAVSFDIQTQIAAGLERIRGLKGDLLAALGVNDVALSQDGGRWQLRVSRPDDPTVPLLRLLASIPPLPPLVAAIGVSEGGQPILVRFSANRTGHVLIAGETGAGKSSLLRTIAVCLALTNRQSGLQLQVMDPKWQEGERWTANSSPLMPLAYIPHMLTDPALGIESCSSLVHFLAQEMVYRRGGRVQTPRIVVLMDHALAFVENAEPEAVGDLLRLLQYGAQAGIHVILATDRADSPLWDSTIKASLSMRIIGRLSDAGIARRIAGVPVEQAPLLYGEGDFLAVVGDEVTYFQAAYIGDYDLHLKLNEMFQEFRPRLLARPYSSRPRSKKNNDRAQPAERGFSVHDGSVDLADEEDGDPGEA